MRIHVASPTHITESSPSGKKQRRTRRLAARLLLFGLIGPLITVGCERDETAGPSDASTSSAESTPASESPAEFLLSYAPWFRLPEDWDEQHPVLSPNAKTEAHFLNLAERNIPLSAADGAGRAWITAVTALDSEPDEPSIRLEEGDPREKSRDDAPIATPAVQVSSLQRIELVFEVGPLGIEEGGLLYIMPEPFWSWSEVQLENPMGRGYTTALPRVEGVRLEPIADGAFFEIVGRALDPGERIDIVMGAGPSGTRVDEFAERGSEILIAVDAEGDGTRAWLEDSARLDIVAREGTQMIALGPAEVAPGDPIEITLAIVDERGNRARWPGDSTGVDNAVQNTFAIETIDGPSLIALGLDEATRLVAAVDAPYRIRFTAPASEGTIRLSIRGLHALEGFDSDVNPIVVRQSATRLIWADLHGHSQLSDGTGTPEDYFHYARDIARLDAVALTDHDHWGLRPIDQSAEIAAKILETSLRFHERDRFVTIPGYEWTSWLHGHRHVLYFEEDAPIYSAVDFATDRPDELWEALRGRPALTFAHHSAGEPVATNWFFQPDPELEPLTEITSIHGMSEAADAPLPIYGAIEGNYVRDVLIRGARLGFIGSGDSHDGHPGLAGLAAADQSGLAGIFTATLDRPGLLDAMRARHTFATNGIRPWLSVSIDEARMGESMPSREDEQATHRLHIRYEATAPIVGVDLIRTGRIANLEGNGALSLDLERIIPHLAPGEFHYVRIIQEGGGVAWSSPIFIDPVSTMATEAN